MRKVSCGVDIIEVERIAKLIRRNRTFVKRVFTEREIAYCGKKKFKWEHFAVRFAAKEAVWKALCYALAQYGRPYDYNFDFTTDNALVCSELVCKAYRGVEGLDLEPSVINGRVLFTPNFFAKKFAEERGREDAQLDLVLFLDGNEGTNRAEPAGADAFADSWKRPKWYVFTQ